MSGGDGNSNHPITAMFDTHRYTLTQQCLFVCAGSGWRGQVAGKGSLHGPESLSGDSG